MLIEKVTNTRYTIIKGWYQMNGEEKIESP